MQQTNCHPFRYGKWLFLHNGEIEELQKVRRINPATAERSGDSARAIVSEAIGEHAKLWRLLPGGSFLRIRGGEIEVMPFEARV